MKSIRSYGPPYLELVTFGSCCSLKSFHEGIEDLYVSSADACEPGCGYGLVERRVGFSSSEADHGALSFPIPKAVIMRGILEMRLHLLNKDICKVKETARVGAINVWVEIPENTESLIDSIINWKRVDPALSCPLAVNNGFKTAYSCSGHQWYKVQ